jgi:hypothetical protein
MRIGTTGNTKQLLKIGEASPILIGQVRAAIEQNVLPASAQQDAGAAYLLPRAQTEHLYELGVCRLDAHFPRNLWDLNPKVRSKPSVTIQNRNFRRELHTNCNNLPSMSEKQSIVFIGLGAMGIRMARHLLSRFAIRLESFMFRFVGSIVD